MGQAQPQKTSKIPSGPYTCFWARTRLAQKRKRNRGNYFPPRPLLAERFCMQETKFISKTKKKCAGGESVPGVAETTVCWRCGGGSNGGERDLFSVAFSSVFSLFSGSVSLFLVCSCYPLSFVRYLSSPFSPAFFFLSLSPLRYFSPLSPSSVLSIYSAPSITQRLVGHWGVWWWWGRGGREAGRFLKIFVPCCC